MKNLFKKLTTLSFIVLLTAQFQSCQIINEVPPRGNSTRDFSLDNFDRLEVGSAINVVVKQGTTFSVQAAGELNDLDDLIIRVDNDGELKAGYNRQWRNRRPMEITITMPTLKGVDFSGATRSTIGEFQNSGSMEIELSGASKSFFEGKVDRLEVDLSGASELKLEGESRFLEVDLSGASTLNGFGFQVEDADLEISGASTSRVTVSTRLKVKASGASKVRYKGNPTVNQDLSGSSSVIKE